MTFPSTIRKALAAAMLLALTAPAAGAMRCGTELISEGDSVVKLLEHCGEPSTGDPALFLGAAEWTYNFGPNEFMKRVLIQDGRVERIEELGWGVEPPLLENEEAEP